MGFGAARLVSVVVFGLVLAAAARWPSAVRAGQADEWGRKNLAFGSVVVKVMQDVPIIRGEARNGADRISYRSRSYYQPLAILSIGDRPGQADYREKKDFDLQDSYVSWAPRGREPAPDAVYYVSFRHVASEKDHNTDGSGFYVTDGRIETGWRAISPTWIYLDLKASQTVTEIRLYQPESWEAKTLRLQWAPDGASKLGTDAPWKDATPAKKAWRNPMTGSDIKAKMLLPIEPTAMRYFRLVAPDGCKQDQAVRINEIELYGPAEETPRKE